MEAEQRPLATARVLTGREAQVLHDCPHVAIAPGPAVPGQPKQRCGPADGGRRHVVARVLLLLLLSVALGDLMQSKDGAGVQAHAGAVEAVSAGASYTFWPAL
eukprot:scaffold5014_cov387-Prasinococcus_capsulatus_cf.AAC.11